MGNAKHRGTFEERKEQAIIRNKKEAHARFEEYKRKERLRTPEEKAKQFEMQNTLTYLTALGMSLGMKLPRMR